MGQADDLLDEGGENFFELSEADGAIILESLKKIKYQTSRHLCINTGLSIGTVVDWLDTLKNIRKQIGAEQVGGSQAYYLLENQPVGKLFLGGDNSVHERIEEPKPAHTSKYKIGDKVVVEHKHSPIDRHGRFPIEPPLDFDPEEIEELAKINPDKKAVAESLGIGLSQFAVLLQKAKFREAYECGLRAKAQKSGAKPLIKPEPAEKKTASGVAFNRADEKGEKTYMENLKKKTTEPDSPATGEKRDSANENKRARKRISWSEQMLENLAATHGTTYHASKVLKVSDNTIRFQIKKSPANAAAWERGREIFLKNKEAGGWRGDAEKNSEGFDTGAKIVAETKEIQRKVITADASREKSETAEDSDKPPELPQPANGAAPAGGECGLMVDERFAHTLEHISENGHSREKLEEVQNKLLGTKPLKFPKVSILGERAKIPNDISVSFYGDFFALPKEKRIILLQMADLKDAFEEENL